MIPYKNELTNPFRQCGGYGEKIHLSLFWNITRGYELKWDFENVIRLPADSNCREKNDQKVGQGQPQEKFRVFEP